MDTEPTPPDRHDSIRPSSPSIRHQAITPTKSNEPRTIRTEQTPRLLDRLRIAIRTRHYSERTERTYVRWVIRFVRHHGMRHPGQFGAKDLTAFLSSLAINERLSASSQNQALAALLFLYRNVISGDLP